MQPRRFYLTHQHRHGRGHVMAPRSRFLPDEVLGLFTRRTATPNCAADAMPSRPTAPVDIGAPACATCGTDPSRPRNCRSMRRSLNVSISMISAVRSRSSIAAGSHHSRSSDDAKRVAVPTRGVQIRSIFSDLRHSKFVLRLSASFSASNVIATANERADNLAGGLSKLAAGPISTSRMT